jgi:hypothetical protein
MPGAGILFFGLTALIATPLSAAELRCPPLLPGPHPGFDQVGPIPTAHWQLAHMRLFDGPPGEETKEAPAELAPDTSKKHRGGFTNIWSFGGSENLLMVCAYDGSRTYYRTTVRALPKSCTEESNKGLVQGWCQ